MNLSSELFSPQKRNVASLLGLDPHKRHRDTPSLVAFVAFLILVFVAPLLTFRPSAAATDDSSIRQIGYVLTLMLAAYGARNRLNNWENYIIPLPIFLTLLWFWASTVWAIDPANSLRRTFLTTIVVLTAFWTVRPLGYERTIATLRIALAVLLVVNILVVYLDPVTGVHQGSDNKSYTIFGGMWRGIMVHKNFAGAACAITILLFLFDAKSISPAYKAAVISASCVFLYASQSKTSMGMTLIAILAGLVFKFFTGRLRNIFIALIIFGTAVFYVVMQIFADQIKNDFLGPTAFTGRGHIWMSLINYSNDNPWLGSGFGSFWNIGFASPIYKYGSGFTTQVTVGHNGYLDLLITTGYPGLVLAVFSLTLWPIFRTLATPQLIADRAGLICALLVFCVGHNFTESSLYDRDALVGVTLLFTAAIAQYFPSARIRKRSGGKDASKDASRELMRTLRKRNKARAAGSAAG